MTPPLALNRQAAEKCKFPYLFSTPVQCIASELSDPTVKNCPMVRGLAVEFCSVSKTENSGGYDV